MQSVRNKSPRPTVGSRKTVFTHDNDSPRKAKVTVSYFRLAVCPCSHTHTFKSRLLPMRLLSFLHIEVLDLGSYVWPADISLNRAYLLSTVQVEIIGMYEALSLIHI